MSDTSKNPKVATLTIETEFTDFDSIMLIDAGSDGFRIKDSAGTIVVIPSGIPVSIAGPAGMLSGYISVMPPVTGSMNVSALYYK